MKSNVEDTRIYRYYLDLINYLEMITEKYPKNTKLGIVSTIKTSSYAGIELILKAYKAYEKKR